MWLQTACALLALLLAAVPCGAEGFLTCFISLVAFHREQSVHSVGVRPYRNVWMQPFVLLLRICLSSCVK
jgi:hypothetical protein